MDEGFWCLPGAAHGGCGAGQARQRRSGWAAAASRENVRLAREASPLCQRRASSVVAPPRPIPNRVVKHYCAAGTGSSGAGRQRPCAFNEKPPRQVYTYLARRFLCFIALGFVIRQHCYSALFATNHCRIQAACLGKFACKV